MSIPKGYKLVPVSLTDAMRAATAHAGSFDEAWGLALAAVPELPQSAQPVGCRYRKIDKRERAWTYREGVAKTPWEGWEVELLYAEQPSPVAVVPTMQAELAQANRQLSACAEQIEEQQQQQRLTAAEDLLRRARAVIEDRGWAELERDIAKFFKPQVKG